MIYKTTISNDVFRAIAQGNKIVDFCFDEDKYESIQIDDFIEFVHENNPFRSIRGKVESKISASNLASFFKVVSPVDCGLDSASVDKFIKLSGCMSLLVSGIRFSLDKNRPLEEIAIPFEQVNAYIEKAVAETINTQDDSNRRACFEWDAFRAKYSQSKEPKDNLLSIVEFYDACVASYVAELAFELYERMRESGYDDISDFLDRPFDLSNYYIVEWWTKTRLDLVAYYCGCAQRDLPYFTCRTIFDEEG